MLSQDFKEFIESLNSNAVRYLVIGGYALAVYIIDIEDLKKNKRATGRTQDLADLEALESNEKPSSQGCEGSSPLVY